LTLTNNNNQKTEDKMKNKNLIIFISILAFTCLIAACENPIMERWWVDNNRSHVCPPGDPNHVCPPGTIILVPSVVVEIVEKEVIEYIYEYIYQIIIPHWPTVPPPSLPAIEVIAEHIHILNIDFIIFAGNQEQFNLGPGAGASTYLTPEETRRNNFIALEMAQSLDYQWERIIMGSATDEFPYFLILHGHANPVTGTLGEITELTALSENRAASVKREMTGLGFDNTIDPNLNLITSLTDDIPYFPPFEWGGVFNRPLGSVPGEDGLGYDRVADADRIATLSDFIRWAGYGGGKTMIGTGSTPYASLNRRVEAILFTIARDKATPTDPGPR